MTTGSDGAGDNLHPKLNLLLTTLTPGRHAGGTLLITEPAAHRKELTRWLMGNDEGRVALGRTAFGDLLVFRDLRDREREAESESDDGACDLAVVDLNQRRMVIVCWSVEEFLSQLETPELRRNFFRGDLYDQVRSRLGALGDDEVYAFVPALGLGGREEASAVQRSNWSVYQDILFQL